MDNVLAYLTHDEKMAVMQVGYQLIESAAHHALGRRICEDDDPSVDIIIKSVTVPSTATGNSFLDNFMTNNIYNEMWNEAIWMNPYEAFDIVRRFDKEEKAAFKKMMLEVAMTDNVAMRMNILQDTFRRVGIDEYV